MSKLPFQTRVRLPARSQDYRLVVEVLGPTNLASLEPVETVLGCFEILADWGAFATERVTPARSRFERLGSSVDVGLRRVYDVHGVHLGAFRILLHALAQCHHHQTPLVLVSLEAEDPAADEATLGAILKSPFPPRAAPPFRLVEPRDLDDVKDPVLHLQFASDVSDADLAALRTVFESWDVIIEMGGYADGCEPLEDFFIELGSTHLGSPSLVDHAAYNIRFPPAAVFDAAINVASRANVKLGTLIELSIE
jgi:hypothetical protein